MEKGEKRSIVEYELVLRRGRRILFWAPFDSQFVCELLAHGKPLGIIKSGGEPFGSPSGLIESQLVFNDLTTDFTVRVGCGMDVHVDATIEDGVSLCVREVCPGALCAHTDKGDRLHHISTDAH